MSRHIHKGDNGQCTLVQDSVDSKTDIGDRRDRDTREGVLDHIHVTRSVSKYFIQESGKTGVRAWRHIRYASHPFSAVMPSRYHMVAIHLRPSRSGHLVRVRARVRVGVRVRVRVRVRVKG